MIATLTASAALVLVLSGVAKLARPGPAAATVRSLVPALPARAAARAVAIGELLVGAITLAAGGHTWAALAAAYLALGVVASALNLRSRRSGQRVACGCFGASDAPVGQAHLILDGAGLLVATLATIRHVPGVLGGGLGGLAGRSQLVVGTAALQVLLLTALAWLAITALPSLAAARRAVLSRPTPRAPELP